jgi:biofilm PGA synthesis N-glycosyltransferase PgaC
MNWLEVLVVTILFVYTFCMVITILVLLFSKKESYPLSGFTPKEKISIIIPFRNEEQNILACLQGIVEQEFPQELVEIILVDDHSEDTTTLLSHSFLSEKQIAYRIIELKEHNCKGKKQAIELGVAQSSGKIIITRDADTYAKNNLWLKSIACHFQNTNCDVLLAPVILSGTSFLQAFQKFENIAITSMGYAFAKIKLPFVCSGANLAYKKESFLKADPFKSNKHIASGDDMFLLQSFLDNGFLISTAKDSSFIVYTNAETGFRAFLNQRLRWASKAKSMEIKTAWLIASLLFLTNTELLITCLACLINAVNINFCLFALLYKCIIDFLLLFLGSIMYRLKPNFAFYIPAFIANLFYVSFVTMASIFINPSWKGRKRSV